MECRVAKVPWRTIRPEVAAVNRRLAEALDQAQSGVKRNLFDAWYPYGSLIVEDGQFRPPCGAGSGVCEACQVLCRAVQEGCGGVGQTIPLTLVLSQCAEVFISVTEERIRGQNPASKRTVPLRIVARGEVFGSYEATDLLLNAGPSFASWSVSAGARSVFILTHLKNKKVLKHLSDALKARSALARECEDWELVRYFANWEKLEWGARVLIISDPKGNGRPDWHFRDTVFDIAWRQSRNARLAVFEDLRSGKRIRPVSGMDPHYYNSTLRHLIAIARGDVPAFAPVLDKNWEAGPLVEFQEFLMSKELCKGPYFPAILQPVHCGPRATVVYYSLNLPTLVARVHEDFKTLRGFAEEIETDLRHSRENLAGVEMQCLGPSVRTKSGYDWDPSDAALLGADFGLSDRAGPCSKLDLSQRFFEACIRVARK